MPQLHSKGFDYLALKGVRLEIFHGSAYDPAKVTVVVADLLANNDRMIDETHKWSEAVRKLEAERAAASIGGGGTLSAERTRFLREAANRKDYVGDLVHAQDIRDLLAAASIPVVEQPTDEWHRTADGIVPTEFDPDDQFFSRKMLICIDGKVSTDAGYYTKSGRWIIAGRHGDAVNVTHWREYPSNPV